MRNYGYDQYMKRIKLLNIIGGEMGGAFSPNDRQNWLRNRLARVLKEGAL